MTVQELKKSLVDNTLDNDFLVLVWKNSPYLAETYYQRIAKNNEYVIETFQTIDEALNRKQGNLVEDILYVVKCDDASIGDFEPKSLEDIVVVCKSWDNGNYSNNDYVVYLPDIMEWQVEELIKTKCPGLDNGVVKWLQKITNNNIYRISSEIEKISLFPKEEQLRLFSQINEDNGFCDLSIYNSFDISNALLKKDLISLRDIYDEMESADVGAQGLIAILIRNFKLLIEMQISGYKCEQLGVSKGQYFALKNQMNYYSNVQLLRVYKFLLSLDEKVKNGKLPLTEDQLMNYVIFSVLKEGSRK